MKTNSFLLHLPAQVQKIILLKITNKVTLSNKKETITILLTKIVIAVNQNPKNKKPSNLKFHRSRNLTRKFPNRGYKKIPKIFITVCTIKIKSIWKITILYQLTIITIVQILVAGKVHTIIEATQVDWVIYRNFFIIYLFFNHWTIFSHFLSFILITL